MQAMENCMEQVLLRGSPKRELPKEAKDAKNTEPQGLPQIPEEPPPAAREEGLGERIIRCPTRSRGINLPRNQSKSG